MSYVLILDECNALSKLFQSLPATLPESPPSSLLPPIVDRSFLKEEGAWAAFNKAMHASFGDKAFGLKIQERGKGLMLTLALIKWVLEELEKKKDHDSAKLVKLWIDALTVAAKSGVSTDASRPRRALQPNRQQLLRESASDANKKAKINQSTEPAKKTKGYYYIDSDGNEVDDDEDVATMVVNPPVHSDSDSPYTTNEVDSSESDSEIACNEELNDEIVSLLQRKIEPMSKKAKKQTRLAADIANDAINEQLPEKQRKRKKKSKNDAKTSNKKARIEDGMSECVTDKPEEPREKPIVEKKRPAIYHFYERVPNNEEGKPGEPGDKHYRCYHGKHKILTVTKKMKATQIGLQNHLKNHFPAMNRLYETLKARPDDKPPTLEELQIAAGKIPLDSPTVIDYMKNLEAKAGPLVDAFKRATAGSETQWDQTEFENFLTKWMVVCDQPFEEVERPEFKALLEYNCRPTKLNIPSSTTIKRRVMKMGETMETDMKNLIVNLDGNVSLSLDAWTSQNGYAFMGIVMHYITKDWKLEECLVDFRELIGEHSGKNMAITVHKTIESLGLKGRIQSIVSDNASNNDRMMSELEDLFFNQGIIFKAAHARGRCLPHIVHLAAIELLLGIGGLSESDLKDGDQRNYQDSATLSISREADENAVQQKDDFDQYPLFNDAALLPPLEKLRKIVRAIRSSPQRRQKWFEEIGISRRDMNGQSTETLKMLILDVRTRWASCHQMCRRALDYQKEIESYVAKSIELRQYELSGNEWEAIMLITHWLRAFRDATTQMSATKHSTFSSTHAIFKGLQDHIKEHIRALPSSASPQIRSALLASHRKLGIYFYKIDESPYPIWACLLDPRINYQRLADDHENEPELLKEIQQRKYELESHYRRQYAGKISVSKPMSTPIVSMYRSGTLASPEKLNFTARYGRQYSEDQDELEEYFRTPSEKNWDGCDPVKWWGARQAQFPNLGRLARDIMTIPGSAVAVERIFSGGRDTISLRRASLKPDTIRTLMLVKQKLKLARNSVEDIIQY